MTVATFIEAVKAGDIAQVRTMLTAQPELVHKDVSANNEHRAIHYAVLRRNEAMVRLLMEGGSNARKGIWPHRDATSALQIARDREYHELVPILDQASETAPTPPKQQRRDDGLLTQAVKRGEIETVKLLLDQGADVDERTTLPELEVPTESWGMPLWHAALLNNFEIAKLLLDRGADPNANVYASGWPLRNAWNHEDGRIKHLLLERGAKLQPYMVSETHDVSEAKRLLEAEPSEDVVHELLWSAADHGCPEIVELALPRLNWQRNDPRWHWVLMQPPRGSHSTVSDGHYRSMGILLEYGIDPNVTRFGQTPLHFIAARNGDVRFSGILLDHGANLNLRDDLLQSTPLGWACRWGRTELVRFLIGRGARVDEPDAEPWATPTRWAEKMNHPEILDILQAIRQ